MELKVKFLKSGEFNASPITGGPYITGVEHEEMVLEEGPATNLAGKGVVEILGLSEPEDEKTSEQDSKDRLMAQAKKLDDVKITGNMKLETMINKITDAGHEPDLGDDEGADDDENNE